MSYHRDRDYQRDSPSHRDYRDHRDSRDSREHRDYRDHHDHHDSRGDRDHRDYRDYREHRGGEHHYGDRPMATGVRRLPYRGGGRGGRGGGIGGGGDRRSNNAPLPTERLGREGYDDFGRDASEPSSADGKSSSSSSSSTQEPLEKELVGQILHVGEREAEGYRLETELPAVADAVVEYCLQLREPLLEILVHCAAEIPTKSAIYATLVGLINAKNEEFVTAVLHATLVRLNACLASNEFPAVRVLLRFIAELMNANVILPSAVLEIYTLFLAVMTESNIPQRRSDAYVHAVVVSLPLVAAELRDRKPEEYERLIDTIDAYISGRNVQYKHVLQTYRRGDTFTQQEYLEYLWNALHSTDEWQLDAFVRPFSLFEEELGRGSPHELLTPQIPPHEPGSSYPVPYVPFRVFDALHLDVAHPCYAVSPLNRVMIEELISDTLFFFHVNHTECARQLSLFTLLKPSVPLEFYLVETIFSHLLRLPDCELRPIYHMAVLTDLCKTQTLATLPRALGKAIRLVFEKLDGFEMDCIFRFGEWFAIHLSNFDYRWNWQEWEYVTSLDSKSLQWVCIRETFAKCVRLSYLARFEQAVPPSFKPLLPPPPVPNFKFADSAHAKRIMELMKGKAAAEKIWELAAEVEVSAETSEEGPARGDENYRFELVMECILALGSSSFSHLLNITERYLSMLQNMTSTPQGCAHMLDVIYSFWRNNPQYLMIVIDKFMVYRILDSETVVNWILSPTMVSELSNGYVYDILCCSISKLSVRVLQLESANAETGKQDADISEEPVVLELKQSLLFLLKKLLEILASSTSAIHKFWTLSCYFLILRKFLKDVGRCSKEIGEMFGSTEDPVLRTVFSQTTSLLSILSN